MKNKIEKKIVLLYYYVLRVIRKALFEEHLVGILKMRRLVLDTKPYAYISIKNNVFTIMCKDGTYTQYELYFVRQVYRYEILNFINNMFNREVYLLNVSTYVRVLRLKDINKRFILSVEDNRLYNYQKQY